MKNVEDIYPLTPMQRGMLFHALHDPDHGLYFEQAVCTLEGELDLPVFQRAWQLVVRRHSALRTAFIWQNRDEPLQVVRSEAPLPWTVDDWRSLPSEEQAARLAEFRADDRRRGIDLSRAPLMRLALFRQADARYTLVWSFHHLLFDGWSLPVILGEVFQSYEAFAAGQTPRLAAVRPYRDYIAWLQRQDLARAEAFWREQLGTFGEATGLGVDRPLRPDAGPLETAQRESFLSPEASVALRAFARQHRLTLNTLLQGAWALLLSRYSGADDLVFGATVSGRPSDLEGVETIAGLFINTLPVRVRLPAALTLRDWLQELQAQQAELRQYEYSALVDVQGWSGVPRGLPLFESLVVFENYPMAQPPADGRPPRLRISGIASEEQTNYALTLCVAMGDVLALKLMYDARRFDTATVDRLLGHLATLLEHLPARPEARLADLPMLTVAERDQLLNRWNATQTAYPRYTTVHASFADQAARTPGATALSYAGQRVSYRELDERANRLAHYLRGLGVGLEARVGLYLNRSTDLIVALLAVLKADAAYVPLDPAYPLDRLTYMLRDAGVEVLITEQALLDRLGDGQRAICLDRDAALIAARPARAPESRATAESLAYVMYTSGSTGQPKGSSITHRSILRLVKQTNFATLSADEVFLQFAPVSFDAATLEVWGALLNGARLAVAPPELLNLADLGQLIQDERVTTLWLTAGLFSQMVDEQLAGLRGVRQLLTGGDVVSPTHVRLVLQAHPGTTVINGYGPTENTTFTCTHPVATLDEVEEPLPIGRPVANTQVYILDRQLRPVPVGVAGDIYAAGDGLARDYHGQPALTAARFIPNPFSAEPGARMYAVGDQGRYRADGTVEFLGRTDDQVKIRGYRIELGEIEAVLSQHPVVRNCVVLAQELVPGQKRLAAFFVPDVAEDQPMLSPRQIREYLKEWLPEYMVPLSFSPVESIPLTPNGKVDRQALLAPDRIFSDTLGAYVAPRDQTELQLTKLWEYVLGVRPIGVYHNFFDLGGQSLLAMRLTTQIQRLFGQRISTATLFREPTIAQLAQRLRAPAEDQPWTPLVSLQEGGDKPPLFLLSPGGGKPFCYIPLVRHLRDDRPIYGLQARGVEPGQQPFQDVGELADCYIEAIRSVQPQGPYLLCGWSAGGSFALEVAQRLRRQGQDIALLCVMDSLLQKPDNIQEVLNYADQLIAFISPQNLPLSIEEFHALDREEQIQMVVELAGQIGLVAPDTGRDQVLRNVDVVGASNRIAMTYDPAPYDGRITLFYTYKDPEEAKYNKVQITSFDALLGWGDIASENLDVVLVSGDHQNMLSMPHVQSVAEQLQIRLDALDRRELVSADLDVVYSTDLTEN